MPIPCAGVHGPTVIQAYYVGTYVSNAIPVIPILHRYIQHNPIASDSIILLIKAKSKVDRLNIYIYNF